MDAKTRAEAGGSLTEYSDARGEAGLAVAMEGEVSMVGFVSHKCLLLS